MMQISWSGKRVKTSQDRPPVPVGSDWSAWLDGSENSAMTIGCGPTEVEAVEDLLGQLFNQVALANALQSRAGRQQATAFPVAAGRST